VTEQSADSEPAGLTAAAKSRAVSSVSGERVAATEWDKLGSPRPRWRRGLLPGSIALLLLVLISFTSIVGAPRDWWPL